MSKTTVSKPDALLESGCLNPHPERVIDPLFAHSDFFDPSDILQVKYEMLRRVQSDKLLVSETVARFGFSRPTFYEVLHAFQFGGITALLPSKRGPHGGHKLTSELIEFLLQQRNPEEPIRAPELKQLLEERFGVSVHPRSIERSLRAREKKRR